jgi:ABC-type glutathione transport system ATPase component
VKYITLSDGEFRARRAYFTKVARGRSAGAAAAAAAGRPPDPGAHQRRKEDAGIELAGVTKRFLTPAGTAFTALRDVDLVVRPGQFCAVVGPTGCGKSTTLTMVAGLDRPSAGRVRAEPVHREALRVGQHLRAANRRGLQGRTGRRRRARRAARIGRR